MKKVLILTIIFIASIANSAHAETISDFAMQPEVQPRYFMLTTGDTKIPIGEETIRTWQYNTNQRTNLLKEPTLDSVTLMVGSYSGLIPFGMAAQTPTSENLGFDIGSMYSFIKQNTSFLKQLPVEPYLEIKNNRAVKFTPPQDGTMPNIYATTIRMMDAIKQQATSTEVVIDHIAPTTLLSQTNSLGIRELVAEGKSNFRGSPSNRRHNIKIGVEKMSGVLIAPGEEFSFNKHLGPVDGQHGFLPELVIKATGTIPEFGGGLCQVSSTTFRAAMEAGFPITQRRNHAYAVQYYAPQGTDATIYPGVIDLKFINDTSGTVLVWPYFKDKDNLVFDFYGTKDDRQVILGKPYQYDRKTDGSMKATWEREVIKNGESKKDLFKSVYRSPALYHKTEEFAATSTPTTGLQIPPPTTQ